LPGIPREEPRGYPRSAPERGPPARGIDPHPACRLRRRQPGFPSGSDRRGTATAFRAARAARPATGITAPLIAALSRSRPSPAPGRRRARNGPRTGTSSAPRPPATAPGSAGRPLVPFINLEAPATAGAPRLRGLVPRRSASAGLLRWRFRPGPRSLPGGSGRRRRPPAGFPRGRRRGRPGAVATGPQPCVRRTRRPCVRHAWHAAGQATGAECGPSEASSWRRV
jgi:hypothetical protein